MEYTELITTSLITLLGTPLARIVLTKWLGGQAEAGDIAEELAGGLKDILLPLIPNLLLRNKSVRTFEDIGDQAAQSLLPWFEHEKESIPAARQEVIILAIAETLPRLTIEKTLKTLLLEHDLDAEELAQSLLKQCPPRQELEEAELRLYRQGVIEACKRVLDIASSLPAFTQATLAEVLSRQTDMLEAVENTLEIARSMYESSLETENRRGQQAAQFETDYRRLVAKQLNNVELFGVRRLSQASKRQMLTIAYIDLQVNHTPQKHAAKKNLGSNDQEIGSTYTAEDANRDLFGDDPTIPAIKALANSPRLLVRGEAGSGKTTLLKWVGVRISEQNYPETLRHWKGCLAIFIRLRDFADNRPLPAVTELPLLINGVDNIAHRIQPEWIEQVIHDGKAVLLVDGLDEIGTEQRQTALAWLETLMLLHPKCSIIVSSRPPAFAQNNQWFKRHDFAIAELQDLQSEAQEKLIDNWHDALFKSGLLETEEKNELASLADHLKTQLRERVVLQELVHESSRKMKEGERKRGRMSQP